MPRFDLPPPFADLPPPLLAPLTGNLEPIAKAFTTSKSNPSSPLFKIYRKQSGIKRMWKNETKCQLLMPDPFYLLFFGLKYQLDLPRV
jgi:hypothetical protein